MDIRSLETVVPFITKDGSQIRELLAHRNSCIRNQSLAEAALGKRNGHRRTLPPEDGGDLLHSGGEWRDAN